MPEKSEFVCHKSRFVHNILCESPFIQGIFTPYHPSFYGIFWGHSFCLYGGWGWSELFSVQEIYVNVCPLVLQELSGVSKGGFLRGGENLNSWGGARTGCNN